MDVIHLKKSRPFELAWLETDKEETKIVNQEHKELDYW